jgi:hypothetical protein
MRIHPKETSEQVIDHDTRAMAWPYTPVTRHRPAEPTQPTHQPTGLLWHHFAISAGIARFPVNLDGRFPAALPKGALDRLHGRLPPAPLEGGLAAPVVLALGVRLLVKFDRILHAGAAGG